MQYSSFTTPSGATIYPRPGDWLEYRGRGLHAKLIRHYCDSVTNHGQPIHFDSVRNRWIALDMNLMGMHIRTLDEEFEKALDGDYDFYIVRPNNQHLESGAYEQASYRMCERLIADPPRYDVWSVIKFWWLFRKIHNQRRKIYKLIDRLPDDPHDMRWDSRECRRISDTLKKMRANEVKLQKYYYCTELWWEIYNQAGVHPFFSCYGVNYCSPREAERFSVGYCHYLHGVYQQREHPGLHSRVLEHWKYTHHR